MNLDISSELRALQERVRRFIADEIVPMVALNIFAPDDGNMHLLEAIARPEHKERWLRPLASGEIRSCFCMTEPDPGAGSDPSMLTTVASRHGDHYRVNGRKSFITGASGAAVAIVMAKLEDGRATMFLTEMNVPGITVERMMDSLDPCFPGGHGVVRFDDVRVTDADVLGELGEGFRYAQVRLSPARLTHCMRWLGAARRAHDVALAYVRRREAFGTRLGEDKGVGFMLADNDMDLHVARHAIWHCAAVLDAGRLGLRIEPRQGDRLGGGLAYRRSLRADARRPGRHARDGGGAHLRRHVRLPHLSRAF